MIERIKLVNYQSHENSTVNFHSGLNGIVGPSDSGKSSILRGLYTVMLNKPSGEDLIRHGSKGYSVMVDVDGQEVERSREGKNNRYSLNDDEFKAFGKDVPDAIESLFDLSDVNVQKQHDSVYLLADSSGEVARKLNQIVRLEKIDEVMKVLGSMQRKAKRDVDTRNADIESFYSEIESLSWIEDAEKLVEEHDQIEGRIYRRKRSLDGLISFVNSIEDIDLSVFDWIGDAEKRVESALEDRSKLEYEEERTWRLNNIVGEIEVINDTIKSMPDLDGLWNKVDEAEKAGMDLRAEKEKVNQVSLLIEGIEKTVDDMEKEEESLRKLEEDFHEEMPDICPLCGQSTREVV